MFSTTVGNFTVLMKDGDLRRTKAKYLRSVLFLPLKGCLKIPYNYRLKTENLHKGLALESVLSSNKLT